MGSNGTSSSRRLDVSSLNGMVVGLGVSGFDLARRPRVAGARDCERIPIFLEKKRKIEKIIVK